MSAAKKMAPKKAAGQDRDLVFGLGSTGLSIARYLKREQRSAVFMDTRDEPPGVDELEALWPDAELVLGADALPANITRIIVSPGIADDNELLVKARKDKVEVVSDIELFAREAKQSYCAITGSNGKSTVTTLLYHMGRADGRKVLAGGNLGEPALDLLDAEEPELYVLELSSFHLQRIDNLPADVAVLLNVSADHLDWHASEEEYRKAKYRIYREARAAVVNRTDAQAADAAKHIDNVISFGLDEPGEGQYGLRVEDDELYLARGDSLLIAVEDMRMVGRHNQANALAALAAGELCGFKMSAMLQVLSEFPGLPHRMQFVARKGAVNYINDSKATNVAAAVASIDSIDGELVLVAGGEGKGGDFGALAAALEGKLRAAVLIGTDAEAIAEAIDTVMPVYFARDMDDAVCQAASYAESDDTVLLAPACASFDQFENYGARGDAFAAAVGALTR
ncbi:MAG: UDP-N-acetylmuramoyl-L-alanine--D-glutamate ligase [Woeseiaceae bacterium]|nr:UDP-N-acetylmuramoyl-L-alanine--D-glutamate ligase [Woeseiaceae bacterium]